MNTTLETVITLALITYLDTFGIHRVALHIDTIKARYFQKAREMCKNANYKALVSRLHLALEMGA